MTTKRQPRRAKSNADGLAPGPLTGYGPTTGKRNGLPEHVGDLTIVEANELRTRNKVVATARAQAATAIEQAQQLQNVVTLLELSIQKYVEMLVANRGLSLADSYQVSDVTGQVLLVGRRAVPDMPPQPDADAAALSI